MDIVYATSDLYSKPAMISIKSLLVNNLGAECINIYYIENGLSDENKELLLQLVHQYNRNIYFIPMPEKLNEIGGLMRTNPIVYSYGDTYFYDKYEFIPKDGFRALYEKIIDHPNITVRLGVDALERISFSENKVTYDGENTHLIYTGAIDELFDYKFGVLPYRSLFFDFKCIKSDSFQNVAIVAYPQVKDYTRITEYTKMPIQDGCGWTNVAYEYPVPYDKKADVGNEPYYPVLTEQSHKIYTAYKDYAQKFDNLILCGRLAEFKYYNMDQVVLRALELYKDMEVK